METPQALTLEKQAEKAYHSKKYQQAAQLFLQASDAYEKEQDLKKKADLANNASVALLQAGDAQAALDASQGTEEYYAQTGNLRSQALAIGNQASALESLNRLEEALSLYRLCNDLLKQVGDEDHRAYVLAKISAIQIRTGHQLEALASMDAALTHKKKLTFQERFLKKLLRIPMDMVNRNR